MLDTKQKIHRVTYFFLFLVGFEPSELFLFVEAVEAGAEEVGEALAGPQKRGNNLACPEEEFADWWPRRGGERPRGGRLSSWPRGGGWSSGWRRSSCSSRGVFGGGRLVGTDEVDGPVDGGGLVVPVEVVFGGGRLVGWLR